MGVDLVYEMLAAGKRRRESRDALAAADIRALPFPANRFDTTWCRLVLGHLPKLEPAYHELARVGVPGGYLIVTDFHAEAMSAGHVRTFRDRAGVLHAVDSYHHTRRAHEHAAREAGFRLDSAREWTVGPEIKHCYAAATALDQYERQIGVPLLLAFRFSKEGGSHRQL